METDGLWLAEFATSFGKGSGVVVFNGARILGGDGGFFYFGTLLHLDTSRLKATLEIRSYKSEVNSAFGPLRQFVLDLDGSYSGDLIIGRARVVESDVSGTVQLKRVVRKGF